ncbi:MAG: hypothetical protein KGL17_04000 [Betaproteobacteria bacterium]|nr:hypothetical protein [Betaproteobacteria bacterium]
MSDYTGAATTVPMVINGVHAELAPASVAAAVPGKTVKTPTKNFTITYQGLHISGMKGIPIVCDAAMLAALTATSAPVV